MVGIIPKYLLPSKCYHSKKKKKKEEKNKNRENKFDEWIDGSKGAFSLVYLSIWVFYFA